MSRSSDRDRAELYGDSKDGVITLRALLNWGLSSSTVSRRCRQGGPWHKLLPGVVLMSSAPPTRRQQVDAAMLYAGTGALVTGLEAAARHGLRKVPPGDAVHVLVPIDRRRLSREFVVVERTARLPEAVVRDGLPLAPVVRAVLDGARRLKTGDMVCALVADAVQRRRCTARELIAELEAGSRRGTGIPRSELRAISHGVHSVAEKRAHQLARRTSLPPLLWNPTVLGADGEPIAQPDAWADDVALAWEIDSLDYHLSPADYARTLARRTRMVAAGIVVLATLPSRIRQEPKAVARELEAAYQQATCRPRPPLRALPHRAKETGFSSRGGEQPGRSRPGPGPPAPGPSSPAPGLSRPGR